jgi:glycerophosphoryl diester phosphodiesterase
LKNYLTPFDHLPIRIVELIKELKNEDSILFSSFRPLNLIRIRRLLPGAKTALLLGEGFYWRILSKRFFSFLSPEFIHPHLSYIDPEFIENEHRYGRRINVWTTNEPEQVKSFIRWGVDGLITDDPGKILSLLSQKR